MARRTLQTVRAPAKKKKQKRKGGRKKTHTHEQTVETIRIACIKSNRKLDLPITVFHRLLSFIHSIRIRRGSAFTVRLLKFPKRSNRPKGTNSLRAISVHRFDLRFTFFSMPLSNRNARMHSVSAVRCARILAIRTFNGAARKESNERTNAKCRSFRPTSDPFDDL